LRSGCLICTPGPGRFPVTTDVRPSPPEATYEQLPPKERRLHLFATLVRPFIGGVLLVVLYYSLPLNRTFDLKTGLLFFAGLCAVGVIVAIQVRQIVHSRYPRLRAIGALAVSVPMFLVLFATAYLRIAHGYAHAFSQPLNKTDSLYYTVTVFSTVGFGDIVPKLQAARIVTMIQMLGDLALLGLIGKVLLGAVSMNLQRTRSTQTTDGGRR
jgi:voltage-gated potassium channel